MFKQLLTIAMFAFATAVALDSFPALARPFEDIYELDVMRFLLR